MLRISLIRNKTGPVVLRFEGNMTGPWVEEAHRFCQPLIHGDEPVRIDLEEVGFADRAGLEFLTMLQQREAMLENCPAFLKAQLNSARQPSLAHATACAAAG